MKRKHPHARAKRVVIPRVAHTGSPPAKDRLTAPQARILANLTTGRHWMAGVKAGAIAAINDLLARKFVIDWFGKSFVPEGRGIGALRAYQAAQAKQPKPKGKQ